ncbi:unnamed protein product [Mytilus coruscus]|uniref:Uncharacterized protein n=1 Tax=Mytilus coruscus TaxID=42192 RepID=A0A6J8D4F1_MYTCO|nr:unnamed protein product [Mytilus coruscus]
MLQKLADFWTSKDWKVLQTKEKRPSFGPLRKVQDSSSDKPTPVEWLSGTIKHQDSVRFTGGSGEPVKDNRKVLDGDFKKLPNTSHVQQSNINESTDNVAPGFFNIQNWRENFERKMQIPTYTGFCTSYTNYSDHLASHCKSVSLEDDQPNQQDIYWNEESYYRSAQEIREHNRKSDISKLNIASGIDSDIADIAAQLMQGDSVLDVVDKMAAKDDWKSKICFSKTDFQSQPAKTRTLNLNDCSEVVVNLIEKTHPMLHKKPISNTKTPCHTPFLPVHRQNAFNQIPISTNSLLHRSNVKLNFLSSKQRADPSTPLIRSKSDCEVNFSNIWDSINQRFVVCSAYENRRSTREVPVFTSTSVASVPTAVVTENRKRKASSTFTNQPAAKRQYSGNKKSLVAPRMQQVASSSCNDLFATPLFIPSKHDQTVCFSSATKSSAKYFI